MGTEIRQYSRGQRSGPNPGQIEHSNAVQNPFSRNPFLLAASMNSYGPAKKSILVVFSEPRRPAEADGGLAHSERGVGKSEGSPIRVVDLFEQPSMGILRVIHGLADVQNG